MAAPAREKNTKSNAPDRSRAPIGSEIRDLRKAKGLKLAELAVSIGRSIGFVSQIERGLSEVSVQDLRRIATTLGVPLGWFFMHEDTPEEERGHVVRAVNRRSLGSAETGLTEELLSPDLGGEFELVLSTFEPGAELPEAARRDTDEAGYLVSGELELWIGERRFHLAAGDSFRIRREPFRWRNPGKDKAVVVWVIAPPVY